MKILIPALCFWCILGLCTFSACNSSSEESSDTITKTEIDDNPYADLRTMALDVTPDNIGMENAFVGSDVYGIIMDWNLGDGIATLVAFASGDASIYLSSGGAFMGAGAHAPVREAIDQYLAAGQNSLKYGIKAVETPLPSNNAVHFYFLTSEGKYSGQENMRKLENGSSEWALLFTEANLLMEEIRKVSGD